MWHTAYTQTFGSTQEFDGHGIDWKSKYKDDLTYLRCIESQLKCVTLGSEVSLTKCPRMLQELWKLVRLSSQFNATEAVEDAKHLTLP